MTKLKVVSAAATAALLISPALAFAQVGSTAQVQVGGNTGPAYDTNLETNVNGSVAVPVGGSVGASTTPASQPQDSSASASGGAQADLSLDANADGIAVSSSEQVSTDADLQVFGKNLAKIDTSVRSVTTSNADRIDVGYKHRGKLFGFIPVSVTSHTVMTVDANNEPQVTTSMPWWNFLVSGTHSISANVDASLSPDSPTAVLVSANASAMARARAVEAIVNAHNQAEAEVQAGATASAQSN